MSQEVNKTIPPHILAMREKAAQDLQAEKVTAASPDPAPAAAAPVGPIAEPPKIPAAPPVAEQETEKLPGGGSAAPKQSGSPTKQQQPQSGGGGNKPKHGGGGIVAGVKDKVAGFGGSIGSFRDQKGGRPQVSKGYSSGSYHDIPFYITILYRLGAFLAAASAYVVAGLLQGVLFKRVIPDDIFNVQGGGWIATAAVVLMSTVFLNSLESMYRNTDSEGTDVHWVGWAAYIFDALLIFFGFIVLRGFAMSWFPYATKPGIPMTWVDFLIMAFLTFMLVFANEPLMEYALSGKFRLFGKRF